MSILGYCLWNFFRKGSRNSFVSVVLTPIRIHPVSKFINSVNLLSPFAMYSYASNQFVTEAIIKNGEAIFTLGDSKLDESPDTGDYINPKWVLIIGLAALGITLLLWKKKI